MYAFGLSPFMFVLIDMISRQSGLMSWLLDFAGVFLIGIVLTASILLMIGLTRGVKSVVSGGFSVFTICQLLLIASLNVFTGVYLIRLIWPLIFQGGLFEMSWDFQVQVVTVMFATLAIFLAIHMAKRFANTKKMAGYEGRLLILILVSSLILYASNLFLLTTAV